MSGLGCLPSCGLSGFPLHRPLRKRTWLKVKDALPSRGWLDRAKEATADETEKDEKKFKRAGLVDKC